MHRLVKSFAHALVVLLLLAGCAKQSDEEKLRESLRSWRATLDLAVAARREGKVPQHYLRNTAQAAQKELEKSCAQGGAPEECRAVIARAKELGQ